MTVEDQASSVGTLRLVGQGAEAEVFEWRDGRVLKLLRARGATERLACEVAALEAAHSAGVRVPRVYEQVVVDGRPGLVMQRVEGTDLLSALGQEPWLVFRAGRLTGETQARINGARAPASLPMVRDVMRAALARLARRGSGGIADWAERILGRPPDGEASAMEASTPANSYFQVVNAPHSIGRGPSAVTLSSITRAPGSCSAWVSRRLARSSL